jgi:hypothetical protein
VEDAQAVRVALRLQGNLLHFASIQKGNPSSWQCAAKGILQAAPVKLVRLNFQRWRNSVAQFHPPGDILVAIGAEEKAQAKFRQLLRFQMLSQPQDISQVVSSDLDGGLTHFMGGFRDGMFLLLGNEDSDGWTQLFKL